MQITIETQHSLDNPAHRDTSWHLACNGDSHQGILAGVGRVTVKGIRKGIITGSVAELNCLGHAILYAAALADKQDLL